jgi:uncharacterized protein (DUF1330 family)
LAAYFIAEVEWHQPDRIPEYERLLMPSVEKFAGRFLAASEHPDVVEGEWHGRAVILRFDTIGQAREWYASPEYAQSLAIRHRSATSNLVLLER